MRRQLPMEISRRLTTPEVLRVRLARAFRLTWLGQTAASLCWIGSVLAYEISATGDWLQLFAASSWLLANIAALATAEEE